MPTPLMRRHWIYSTRKINNDNSHKTVKSRLTLISAFSIMVTVTLIKTAVAKNLSQSIIIFVEHQNFSKCIRQPCQYPTFGGMPGHPLASITRRHWILRPTNIGDRPYQYQLLKSIAIPIHLPILSISIVICLYIWNACQQCQAVMQFNC